MLETPHIDADDVTKESLVVTLSSMSPDEQVLAEATLDAVKAAGGHPFRQVQVVLFSSLPRTWMPQRAWCATRSCPGSAGPWSSPWRTSMSEVDPCLWGWFLGGEGVYE